MSKGFTINGSATGTVSLTLQELGTAIGLSLPQSWTSGDSVSISDLVTNVDTGTGDYSVSFTAGAQLEAPGLGGAKMSDVVITVKATKKPAPGGGGGDLLSEGAALVGATQHTHTYDMSFSGWLELTHSTNTFYVNVSGEYDTDGDTWSIAATTTQEISVAAVINTILGEADLSALTFLTKAINDGIIIKKLSLKASHGSDGKDSFKAKVDFDWTIDLIPGSKTYQLPITGASITLKQKDGGAKEFKAKGNTIAPEINTQVEIEYKYKTGSAKDDGSNLSMKWEDIKATYKSSGGGSLTFKAKNWNVGQVLVSLAKTIGIEGFELESPWNLLNDIEIQELDIVFDFSSHNISLTCDFASGINLYFIDIYGFTLERKKVEEKHDVLMTLNAKAMPGLTSLPGWNDLMGASSGGSGQGKSINNMPSVPGKGNKYFDLEYLGLGQRVTVASESSIDTVEEAINYLENAFKKPSTKSPVPDALEFNANSSWLIATDLKLLDAIKLGFVFNDPSLYGLLIEVDGIGSSSKAGKVLKVLNGLKFEILYKKISSTIGMYYIELKLPSEMRHLQFGEVAVTLPVLSLNIYTNGNFKIDVGYPVSMTNFSNCLTIQAFPFTGSGGFYFADLDEATAKGLPVTTKGTFHPVIEFGFAMNLGLGKSIHKGMLKAGISVVALGSLQGTMAWFHPTSSTSESDMYYRLLGTFGLMGKVYGDINFAIVQANVSLIITARASTVLESYKDIPLTLFAEVEAHAEISIDCGLFTIHIGFSFHTSITEHMTVGSNAPTSEIPWYSGGSNGQIVPPEYFTSFDQTALGSTALPTPKWSLFAAPTDAKHHLQYYFVPQVTFESSANPQYVAMLYMDAPATAASYASKNPPMTPPPAGSTSFEKLSKGILLWVINSMQGTQNQTLEDTGGTVVSISDLKSYLKVLESSTDLFTVEDIESFLQKQFNLNIRSPHTATQAQAAYMALFPMFPGFKMHSVVTSPDHGTTGISINFNDFATGDSAYLKDIQSFFAGLATDYEKNLGQTSSGDGYSASGPTSIAAFVFQDYFLMLAKTLLQHAIDYPKNYSSSSLSGTTASLSSIVTEYTTLSADNLVNAVSLAEQNGNLTLGGGIKLLVNGFKLPASQPSSPTSSSTISDICSRYNVTEADFLEANLRTPNLFPVGTTFNFTYQGTAQTPYTTVSGNTLHSIIRVFEAAISNAASISAGALLQQNNPALSSDITVTIPNVLYLTKAGDTVTDISGHYLSPGAAYGTAHYQSISVTPTDSLNAHALLSANTQTPGVFLPGVELSANAATHTVKEGDTVEIILGKLSNATITQLVAGTAKLPHQTATSLDATACLSHNVTWMIPAVEFETTSPTQANLAGIANSYSITVADLALSNEGVPGIWADSQDVVVPNLVALSANTIADGLIATKDATKGSAMVNTAGMGSRVFMSGLQLPNTTSLNWVGPSFITAGTEQVTDGDGAAHPSVYGLYNLTGQQFGVNLSTNASIELFFNGLNMTVVDPAPPQHQSLLDRVEHSVHDLLHHEHAETVSPNSLTVPMTQNEISKIQAKQTALGTLSFGEHIHTLDPTKQVPIHFALGTVTNWKYPGILATGITSNKEIQLIPLSRHTMNYIHEHASASAPVFTLNRVDQHHPTYNPTEEPITDFIWAASITMEIKELPHSPTAKGGCYELLGVDHEDLVLLKRLLAAPSPRPIESIVALYRPVAQSKTPEGYQSASTGNQQLLITQADLSVFGDAQASIGGQTTPTTTGLLMPDSNFLNLLSQASQERNGGYYLYYNDSTSGAGFPSSVFNQKSIGEIELVITYSTAATAAVPDYVNALIAGLPSMTKNTSLYLECIDQSTPTSTMPVGNYGFYATRPNPSSLGAPTTADQIFLLHTFSMLRYKLSGTHFNTSNSSMPLSPKKEHGAADNNTWYYEHTFPLYKFSTRSYTGLANTPTGIVPASNPYLGMGDSASLSFHWVDLFGNDLTTHQPADHNLTMLYRDAIIGLDQLPGLSLTYTINDGNLVLNFTFATQSYGVGGSEEDVEAGIKKAYQDLYTYTQSFYQMQTLFSANNSTAPVVVGTSIDNTLGSATSHPLSAADVNLIYTNAINFLQAVIAKDAPYVIKEVGGILPVKECLPITWTSSSIAIPMSNTKAIFELSTELIIQRDSALIDPNCVAVQHVRTRSMMVKPDTDASSAGEAQSLKGFASQFESSYKSSTALYKLVVGDDNKSVQGTTAAKKLWVAQFGAGGINVTFGSTPNYYAPAPLSTAVVNLGEVSITDYGSSKTTTQNFSSVSLDKWGRTVLEAIDQLLLPEYAIPASIIGNAASTPADNSYEQILAAKNTLANAIAASLAPIESGGASISPNGAKHYRELLLQKLAYAYDVEAIIEAPVTAAVNGTTPASVNLHGKLELSSGSETPGNYSLTSHPLQAGANATDPVNLTTFLSLKGHSGAHKSLSLSDVEFLIQHIEHQLGGTAPASMLSFVLPPTISELTAVGLTLELGGTGDLDVPLLLRSYPTPPSLLGQAFSSDTPETVSVVSDLLEWDYAFTYTLVAAAQDEVSVQINYNATPPSNGLNTPPTPALPFEQALASFIHNYGAIQTDLLGNLPQVYFGMDTSNEAYTKASAALTAFASDVSAIATQWKAWTELEPAQNPTDGALVYTVKEKNKAKGLKMTVTSTGASVGTAVVTIPESPYQPEMVSDSWTGYFKDGNGNYLSYEDRNEYPQRTLNFKGLSLLNQQDAWAGVSIIRNSQLLGSTGPATNSDFVFCSPVVKARNVLTPMLEHKTAYNLTSLGVSGSDISAYLKALMEVFCTSPASFTKAYLRFQIDYRYTLINDAKAPEIILPIVITTHFAYADSSDTDANLAQLGIYINQFVTDRNLQTDTPTNATTGPYHYNGRINIRVEQYSNQNPQTPLAVLGELYVPVGNISSWPTSVS